MTYWLFHTLQFTNRIFREMEENNTVGEKLFTKEQIEHVHALVDDPSWSGQELWKIGSGETCILKMDRQSRLMLVEGNEDTGHQHILLRHSLLSRKAYWKDSGSLDHPTKFPLDIGPHGHFYIAREIFFQGNKQLPKTVHDHFDLYEGATDIYKSDLRKYRLLTYKGTGIIHTIYLLDNKRPFNKQSKLDLRQGWASGTEDLIRCTKTISIPYTDINENECFTLQYRINRVTQISYTLLQVHEPAGAPCQTILLKNELLVRHEALIRLMDYFNFSDVQTAEKIMRAVIKGNYIADPTLSGTF